MEAEQKRGRGRPKGVKNGEGKASKPTIERIPKWRTNATGGRVRKKKVGTSFRNWPVYCKSIFHEDSTVHGYPLMVQPKTFGVHAYKTRGPLVSESGKVIMLEQAKELVASFPTGTDMLLVIGDPRHEHAMTNSNRIGSLRGNNDIYDLRAYVLDYNADGNWLERMERWHGRMGDRLPMYVTSMYDIGRCAWDVASLAGCEQHFLAMGYSAVELRRVCPEYKRGYNEHMKMLRRYTRRTCYPIEWEPHDNAIWGWNIIASWVDPTPTGGKVVPTFRFSVDWGPHAIPSSPIRLLVHNHDAKHNDAPHHRYFWHGLADNPMCQGAEIVPDTLFGTQTLIR